MVERRVLVWRREEAKLERSRAEGSGGAWDLGGGGFAERCSSADLIVEENARMVVRREVVVKLSSLRA